MSVEASSWVWNHSVSKGTARLVLLRIADQADKHGANSWPGVDTIRKDCGLAKVDSVRAAIRTLVDLGELVVYYNAGGDRHTRHDRRPNRYDLPKVPGYQVPEWAESAAPQDAGGRSESDDPPSDGSTTPHLTANDPPSDGSTTPHEMGAYPSLIHPDPSEDPPVPVAVGAEVEEVSASMVEAQEIAGELADLVAVASGAKRKRPSRSSVDGIEKLIRIDEVPAAKVRRMLAWLHESGCDDAEFWKGNVLSGGKLREKWPTLAMKANASRSVGRSKVQRVQDTNQRLLYEANQRIAAEEEERESRIRELEREHGMLGASEWGYLAGQGGL